MTQIDATEFLDRAVFDDRGLIVAVAQDADNGEVLMVAYMDREALHRTLTTGRVWYWSRSRKEYWRKGDTSGHIQEVADVKLDCDADAVLVRVHQTGPACHTGTRSCFSASSEESSVHDS